MGDCNASQERQRELFARLAAERFDVTELSRGESSPVARKMWNAGSENAERIVRRWLDEERVLAGLSELTTAPAMDLRLRHALTIDAIPHGDSSGATPPLVEGGPFSLAEPQESML